MRVGVTLPQTEMGTDPIAIGDYVRAIEDLGYDHIQCLDHVLGANSASRPEWRGPYDHEDLIHEPLILYGFLAGITRKVELVTAIVILPQRQTALVAKQAAEIDVLSGGRLRLGIGIGWNEVEFEALGENFHDRGLRSEEQIDCPSCTRRVVTQIGSCRVRQIGDDLFAADVAHRNRVLLRIRGHLLDAAMCRRRCQP